MKATAVILSLVTVLSGWAIAVEHWQQYGGNCQHNPVAETGAAPSLAQPRWTIQPDFIASVFSTPVVFENRVMIYGDAEDGSSSYVAAYDVADGDLIWKTAVDPAVQESWSSPAVDPETRCVLIGSGQKVFALDVDTGNQQWTQDLENDIFNTSITIAGGRAFIGISTAVSGVSFGDPGEILALDLAADGSILWRHQLGVTANCTAAIYNRAEGDYVIVADTDGVMRALNASDGSEAWSYSVPGAYNWQYTPGGTFWGGVTVADGYAYASTYSFYGGEENSYTYKVNAETGEFVWHVRSERTSVSPVIYNGTVYISGGLNDWGSDPVLAAFDAESGLPQWINLHIGAYTLTPVVVDGKCYIGKMTLDTWEISELRMLDLSLTPADSGFEVSSYSGAGGTASYAEGSIYSVGADGLCAFGELPEPTLPTEGDANMDCKVNIIDLIYVRNRLNQDPASGDNWQADVNSDGKINIIDLIYVRNRLNNKCSN